MTKNEAIRKFVEQDLSGIPQEWVRKIMEADGGYEALPMWGTMWICNFPGAEKLYENARTMLGDKSELLGEYQNDPQTLKKIEKAISDDDWSVLEEYIDQGMSGARNVLDKDGNITPMYVYDVDGHIVLGIDGAGWDFYDGVWNKLYDLLGLQWHEGDREKCSKHPNCENIAH